jgi:coenzyme F420-reducing hydrogenase gamma subunit
MLQRGKRSRPEDFRRNCDVLIAIGQCAIMGGLPAMRNAIMHSDAPLRECLEEAYITGRIHPQHYPQYPQRSRAAAAAR